tara:strand:+ start:11846 stop:12433 length:588 start_codon:yes stop_codon:yes gene_type:complete
MFILNNNWNGILIEPQREMLKKCIKNYNKKENLSFICTALHPTKTVVNLYKVRAPKHYSHTGWASVKLDRFKETVYKNNLKIEKVNAMHLMGVIKKNKLKSVDLLQIDTEGFDWEIIKMYDFHFYKPLLIQYEHCHLSIHDYVKSINLLKNNNYICFPQKNDTIALRKNLINPLFLTIYFFVRLSMILKSRLTEK